jgi:DNA-binding transcriptional LysR family regulator
MDFRRLEHFVAVAEEGHFNRAAARCHIVRSGLSASIRALEKELGALLFVRTTREVRLTPAGLALLGEARRVLACVEAARSAVNGVAGLRGGTLRLAVSYENRSVDPPALVTAFHLAYPDVAISLTSGRWRDIVDDVRTGSVDLGLTYLPRELPANTHFEVLATGPAVVVCAYDHPLATRREVALRELRDETIIAVPPVGRRRGAIEQALEEAGVVRRSPIEVAHLGMLLSLVRTGVGVGIMPGPDAGATSAEIARHDDVVLTGDARPPVCYVPISEPAPRWTYAVVMAPAELRTPTAEAFLELIMGAAFSPRPSKAVVVAAETAVTDEACR